MAQENNIVEANGHLKVLIWDSTHESANAETYRDVRSFKLTSEQVIIMRIGASMIRGKNSTQWSDFTIENEK